MRLTYYNIDIPKYWEHNSNIKDNYDNTVAMRLAYKGIIPPK